MNPADLITRGTDATKITEGSFWINGPEWITRPEREWPTWEGNSLTSTSLADQAEEPESNTLSLSTTDTGLNKIMDLGRYGSLMKLVRITAYILRFVHNCKVKRENREISTVPTVKEIQFALLRWIKNTQDITFSDLLDDKNKQSSIVRQL